MPNADDDFIRDAQHQLEPPPETPDADDSAPAEGQPISTPFGTAFSIPLGEGGMDPDLLDRVFRGIKGAVDPEGDRADMSEAEKANRDRLAEAMETYQATAHDGTAEDALARAIHSAETADVIDSPASGSFALTSLAWQGLVQLYRDDERAAGLPSRPFPNRYVEPGTPGSPYWPSTESRGRRYVQEMEAVLAQANRSQGTVNVTVEADTGPAEEALGRLTSKAERLAMVLRLSGAHRLLVDARNALTTMVTLAEQRGDVIPADVAGALDGVRSYLDGRLPDPAEDNPETPLSLLEHMGTDGARWAEEFLKLFTVNRRYSTVEASTADEFGLMVGWFANAIETGRAAGPGSSEPVERTWPTTADAKARIVKVLTRPGPQAMHDPGAEEAADRILEALRESSTVARRRAEAAAQPGTLMGQDVGDGLDQERAEARAAVQLLRLLCRQWKVTLSRSGGQVVVQPSNRNAVVLSEAEGHGLEAFTLGRQGLGFDIETTRGTPVAPTTFAPASVDADVVVAVDVLRRLLAAGLFTLVEGTDKATTLDSAVAFDLRPAEANLVRGLLQERAEAMGGSDG